MDQAAPVSTVHGCGCGEFYVTLQIRFPPFKFHFHTGRTIASNFL